MACLRCSDCSVPWPANKKYAECPVCNRECKYLPSTTSITEEEAKSTMSRLLFEDFYARREQQRIADGEDSPEWIGKLEAKEEMKGLRALEKAINRTPEMRTDGTD